MSHPGLRTLRQILRDLYRDLSDLEMALRHDPASRLARLRVLEVRAEEFLAKVRAKLRREELRDQPEATI
mgnify:CR=1 FL=1